MDRSTIKLHMQRLAKGYKIWTVPLLILMWDVAFKTANGSNLFDVIRILFYQLHFKAVAIYCVVLGIIIDRWGKLLLISLTDTSQGRLIENTISKHSNLALMAILTPLIYYGVKALAVIGSNGGFDIGFVADIHGLFTLLAVYDGIKILKYNGIIKAELEK